MAANPMAADSGREPRDGVTSQLRLLVVKVADFGDALLTTPALAVLRAGLPDARLDALCGPAGAVAFRHAGLLDTVVVLPRGAAAQLTLVRRLRREHYDGLVYLHSFITARGALKHRLLATGLGAPVRVGLVPPIAWRAGFLTHAVADLGYGAWHVAESFESVATEAVAVFREPAPEPLAADQRRLRFQPGGAAESAAVDLAATWPRQNSWVALHPGGGAFGLARRWPAERFAALAEALVARGHGVALIGRAADGTGAVKTLCRAPLLDLTDACDLPTLGALMPRFRRLITNDSGVMHLAVAMGTPVTAVFGPSSDRSWGPWDPVAAPGNIRHRVVSLDGLPCRPCFYTGHHLGSPAGCATRDCLAWISVERVLRDAPDL